MAKKKANKSPKLYDVKYYDKNGRLIETIMFNQPIALAKWMKRKCENTTHRMGDVKVEENGKGKKA